MYFAELIHWMKGWMCRIELNQIRKAVVQNWCSFFFFTFFLSAPFLQRAQRRVLCSFRRCFYSVKMAVTAAKEEVDYTIKPEAGGNNINTADWPLLLKNYEKRMSNRSFFFLPFFQI